MNARTKFALILASAALAIPQVALAEGPNAKLWNGTWHLNKTKSKFSSPVREESETRSYEITDTKAAMKSTSKNAAGETMSFSYSAGYDSKWYPMTGNPNGDSISLSTVSALEMKGMTKQGNEPAAEFVVTVSPDGRHLTLKRKMLRMEGAPTDVLEFDR